MKSVCSVASPLGENNMANMSDAAKKELRGLTDYLSGYYTPGSTGRLRHSRTQGALLYLATLYDNDGTGSADAASSPKTSNASSSHAPPPTKRRRESSGSVPKRADKTPPSSKSSVEKAPTRAKASGKTRLSADELPPKLEIVTDIGFVTPATSSKLSPGMKCLNIKFAQINEGNRN